MNQLIVKQAASQIGIKEIAGEEDNTSIVAYAREIGLTWINDDETPWCATFVNWVLMKCGYKYLANAGARALEAYGTVVTNPEPGDIIIFWRESKTSGKGHVGFFWGFTADGKSAFVLGGNQANSVTINKMALTNLVGYRRAADQESMEIPEAPLKTGNKGPEVGKLQFVLKFFGLYKGSVDDDFGPNTANAVMAFQIKYNLTRTGQYDTAMKDKLFAILNE